MQIHIPLIVGFTAALVHVLTGPDHLAAVTPLVLERHTKGWKIGAGWGLGHVTGMLLIGLLFYFFKEQIPVEYISQSSERFVGLMLMGIGFWALYRIQRTRRLTYPHTHEHEGEPYTHIHAHSGRHEHRHKRPGKALTAFFIGIVHGFAGISHFILMLPVLGYRSRWDSVQYMLGFAAGIVAAMVLYALVIERFRRTKGLRTLQYLGAFFALAIGVYWLAANA